MIHLALSLFLFRADAAPTPNEPKQRDWLWHIVSECVDTKAQDYCARCLKPAPGMCEKKPCADTTEIWTLTPEYVVFRDRKMCGCKDDFIHGLALPRAKVTGVEDPKKPEGLWPVAWEQAKTRLSENDILLAANSLARRTQDQLHLHLIRLAPGGRERAMKLNPERVPNLERVWAAAERHSKRIQNDDPYGVIVLKAGDGSEDYLVVAVPGGHPETEFGIGVCQR